MLQKILVAMNYAETAEDVFHQALFLAQKTGAMLHLMHVLSFEEEYSPILSEVATSYAIFRYPVMDFQQQWQQYEQRGIDLLRSHCERAIAAGVSTTFTQTYGHSGRSICEFAQNCNADLILIGRHNHSVVSELLSGSVSHYVVHHAPCSVLLVHLP